MGAYGLGGKYIAMLFAMLNLTAGQRIKITLK